MGSRGSVNTSHRIELCILILFLSEALVASESQRNLLGAEVVFGAENLAYFDLPENVELLLQSESNCPEPGPPQTRAQKALLCGTTIKTRECLNLTETENMWTARNCTNEYCVAKSGYPETVCFLESFGISVDIKNKTRRSTCGLDPADRDWLKTDYKLNPVAQPETNGTTSCAVVTPPGVTANVWAECVDDRPEFRYQLNFLEEGKMPEDRPFTCLVSPICMKGRLKARMVCYAEKDSASGDVQLVNAESVEGVKGNGCENSCLPRLGLILFMILFVMYY